MPELPEVETTIRALQKRILNRKIEDVWADFPKLIKLPHDFKIFRKEIKNKKIQKIWRRGKNIIFNLSDGKILLIHQKLTGHLLIGKWKREGGKWKSLVRGPLEEPINRFLHLIFFLDNGQMLGLSDLRKFAKVVLVSKKDFENLEDIKKLGPEPLNKNFNFKKFKEILERTRGKIKQVLMNQEVIAGIGNIYSDEILWEAKIHPLKEIKKLSGDEIEGIYWAMRKILKKAIEVHGESFSDYRTPNGERGGFDKFRKVYRWEGEKCSHCGTIIKRIKMGGRSAHYCPMCQK